MKCTCEIH